MHNIEYDIKINENGRPCIELPVEYENKPEDKFFVIELARYIIHDVYVRKNAEIDPETSVNLSLCLNILGQLGDEIATLLWENMKIVGDATIILSGKKTHIVVQNIEERDNLPMKDIFYDGIIYQRREGLRVWVNDEKKLYILKNGINNENWSEAI
jgi:hypothetical protein